MIGGLTKMIICGILVCVIVSNKACKIDEYLDAKNCFCEKRVIGKLVLEYEDETLNATENSFDHKKVTCRKNNCLIHTISLGIICLLLLTAVSIGRYYYCIRDWT